MPAGGLVTFDYVSGKRVPKDARAQRDEVFQSLKRELSNPALSEDHRLLMLRTSAITHYWNASQVRQLVALITYQRRVDAAIMLFRRCVDPVKYIGEDLPRGEVVAGAAPACTVRGVVVGAGGVADAASHTVVVVGGRASVLIAPTVYTTGAWGVRGRRQM